MLVSTEVFLLLFSCMIAFFISALMLMGFFNKPLKKLKDKLRRALIYLGFEKDGDAYLC